MKINILGQEYDIKKGTHKTDPKLNDASAYVEFYSKEIIYEPTTADTQTINNLKDRDKKVIRHEIAHAFFHESGITEWARDEKLVEWIAQQMPKMVIAMKQAKCL